MFAPPRAPEPLAPDPLDELRDMLAWLRALQEPPWPQASAAMADELRAIGLGKLAGPNGAGLSAAIQEEVERLMVIADRRQHGGMDDAAAPLPTPAR